MLESKLLCPSAAGAGRDPCLTRGGGGAHPPIGGGGGAGTPGGVRLSLNHDQSSKLTNGGRGRGRRCRGSLLPPVRWRGRGWGISCCLELLIGLFNPSVLLHKVINEVCGLLVLQLLMSYSHSVQKCAPLIRDVVDLREEANLASCSLLV